jgi:hypothetical protein
LSHRTNGHEEQRYRSVCQWPHCDTGAVVERSLKNAGGKYVALCTRHSEMWFTLTITELRIMKWSKRRKRPFRGSLKLANN